LQKLLADGLAYASSLRGADLQECNLSRAYLGQRPRTVVTHASLRLLSVGRRDRPQARDVGDEAVRQLSPAAPIDLTMADMFHADLAGASLRGATAVSAVFYTAIARKTVFEQAHLEGADFREAELEGARFTGAWIERARFKGASHIPANVAQLLDQDGQAPLGQECPYPPSDASASVVAETRTGTIAHHARSGMTGCCL
jgi:uncharacterized protein YjbI with pentapeptide repeats